ncbi:sulfur carrier protein ThiS [Hydrogenibacillus schlegelii]|nr:MULTISPECIES: sulfur carrier protein ThiS [Hydrogenibacillus]KWW97095.1 thiamine biosynthesis protein ThiS [Hydrogenibacillus schlegelii]MBE3562601.1 sulfur carrier protein ThiS [Hydrogenibacillus schlegelii]MBT9281609.1 sulfur carrier protein ThiS [Hydrogenibacillus schlegelii]OAR03468.1 thiamine biosynthesis protein ThiS [Hydrogenibacillus schlegelii]QZA33356.1 sulfur carrier protein ThiS [Hydrogenibacillus sp. N12]
MELILNGKKVDLPGVETVYDVLKHYGLEGKIVMVELNEAIVAKDDYARTPLRPNDKLEIVHFVGGG